MATETSLSVLRKRARNGSMEARKELEKRTRNAAKTGAAGARKAGEKASAATKDAKQQAERDVKQYARTAKQGVKNRANSKAVRRELARNAESINAAEYVSGSKKSRNKQFVEEVQHAGTVGSPTNHTLSTMDMAGNVVAMTQSPMAAGQEPDWDDNPDDLDTPDEVREDLRESGLDPMDVSTKSKAEFGHFLVHAMADDHDRGGRTPEQLEAEHDMVTAALDDYGVNHDSPLDTGDIYGGGLNLDFEPSPEETEARESGESPFSLTSMSNMEGLL